MFSTIEEYDDVDDHTKHTLMALGLKSSDRGAYYTLKKTNKNKEVDVKKVLRRK